MATTTTTNIDTGHNAKWRKWNDDRLLSLIHEADDEHNEDLSEAIWDELQMRNDERPLDWTERP